MRGALGEALRWVWVEGEVGEWSSRVRFWPVRGLVDMVVSVGCMLILICDSIAIVVEYGCSARDAVTTKPAGLSLSVEFCFVVDVRDAKVSVGSGSADITNARDPGNRCNVRRLRWDDR